MTDERVTISQKALEELVSSAISYLMRNPNDDVSVEFTCRAVREQAGNLKQWTRGITAQNLRDFLNNSEMESLTSEGAEILRSEVQKTIRELESPSHLPVE